MTVIKAEPICSDTDDSFIDVPVNVCNVLVHLGDPSVKLLAVGHADITTNDPAGFFQHPFGEPNTAPLCEFLVFMPSLMCDSFVTIGLKCSPGPDGTSLDGDFDFGQFDLNGRVVGGWFNADPANGQGLPNANGDVLVAQLAMTDGFDVSGSFTAYVQGDFGGAPAACPDFDEDKEVGPFDSTQLLGMWGPCVGARKTWTETDLWARSIFPGS